MPDHRRPTTVQTAARGCWSGSRCPVSREPTHDGGPSRARRRCRRRRHPHHADDFKIATRLIALSSPYNLIVTNVPGPPMPLYLLGARMREAYPYLPLFEGQGLGIALFSYRDRIAWGLTGDWNMLSDIAAFSDALEQAFGELRLAAAQARLETSGGTRRPVATGARTLPRTVAVRRRPDARVNSVG